MLIYAFRPFDMCYSGPVEVPDGTDVIPKYHTFEPPPEKDGYHAVMNGGWVLVEGPVPEEPPPYVPSADELLAQARSNMVVSPLQAKAALFNAGLLDQLEAYVNNPATDRIIKIAYDNATEWRRLSPMIDGMASQFGLTPEQVDSIFIEASSISF